MGEKGEVSFPMVLVVTIIMIAIVIALVYIFVFNTKEKIELNFASLTESVSQFTCSLAGPLSNSICPG